MSTSVTCFLRVAASRNAARNRRSEVCREMRITSRASGSASDDEPLRAENRSLRALADDDEVDLTRVARLQRRVVRMEEENRPDARV